MDITRKIAEFVAGTDYGSIPEEVKITAKQFVLDAIAAQLAGAREPVSAIVRSYVEELGEPPEAGLIGAKLRASLASAVFFNGVANHAAELESCGRFAGSNLLSVIPVALSIGEKMGLSGEKVLEGIVVGFEVQGKMGIGTTPASHDKGWCSISLHGTFGAAVTAAKLLGLTADQTTMAIGLAASQAGGLMRHLGTMAHLIEGGIGCRNGLLAAILAKKGATASKDILDGDGSFWDVYIGRGNHDPDKMVSNLGNPYYFASPGTMMKKYPCCTFTHNGLDAVLQLVGQHNLKYEEIEAVEVRVNGFIDHNLIGGAEPQSGDMARFSLEHCLAAAIVDGRITLETFTDRKVSELKDARRKIKATVDPSLPSGRSFLAVPVTVKLKDGREMTHTVETVKGSIQLPLTLEEQMERYTSFAGPFLSESQVENSVKLVLSMDRLPAIRELLGLLTFGDQP